MYRVERRLLKSWSPVSKFVEWMFEVSVSCLDVSRLKLRRSGVVRLEEKEDSRVSAVKVGEAISKLPGMLLLGPKPGWKSSDATEEESSGDVKGWWDCLIRD